MTDKINPDEWKSHLPYKPGEVVENINGEKFICIGEYKIPPTKERTVKIKEILLSDKFQK